MRRIDQLLRANIKGLKPYSSARDEFTGKASVYLDANENPFDNSFNRYPDPYQLELKEKIALLKGVSTDQVFLGNGSDEAIDLLMRAFCEPGKDNIISIDPTYGMYQVAADINNVEVRRVVLTDDFQLDVQGLLTASDNRSKLLFICSPNNPTGNVFKDEDIVAILKGFDGIVVLDEAYIDFAPGSSLLNRLNEFSNLVVLQTFSKAWGMAGIRLGMAFASVEIISVLNSIKYPYNINVLTQRKAMELLLNEKEKEDWVEKIISEREQLKKQLPAFAFIQKVYPSNANFLLVKVDNTRNLYKYLTEEQIIVRDRSSVTLCEGCLRITIGKPAENSLLLKTLSLYESK